MKREGYRLIKPSDIEINLIELIASDWMLVTAGNSKKFNTMTANWGGMGYLWNKPVVFVFVRPERYTFGFIEGTDGFTLTFYDETYRAALNICGTKSGKDCDKIAEAELTPYFTETGYPAFKEAKLIIECRKLYSTMLEEGKFIEFGLLKTYYANKGGLHKLYIAEIEKVWSR